MILNRLKWLFVGTLRRQLIVGMVLVVSTIMSAFVWDISLRQRALLRELQSDQAVALARSAATSAAVWVSSRDFSGLQEIVEGLIIYPDLRHAIVLDLRGQILAHSDPTRLGLYLTDLPQNGKLTIVQSNARLVDVVSPVILAKSQIGWVRIGLDTDTLDIKLAEITRHGFYYALVAIFLSILFAILTGRYLTRRLYAIQKIADAVQSGQSELRAVVSGDDEAAQLARQFNSMLNTLEKRNTALVNSEAQSRALISAIPDLIFTNRLDGEYLDVHAPDPSMLFVSPNIFLHRRIKEVLPKAIADLFRETFSAAINCGEVQELNYSLPIDGKKRHFEARVVPSSKDTLISIVRDVTERRLSEEALHIAATAFESHEGMIITNADKVILQVNKTFTEITGYNAEEAVGKTPRLYSSIRHDVFFYAAMWESIQVDGLWQGEVWNRRKNGELFPAWLTITAVMNDEQQATHYVGAFVDITQRKKAEDQIKSLAFYDPLTGLPNRRLLRDRLEIAVAGSLRGQHKGALLFVDLDDFKTINDTLGHDKGDDILVQVGSRLSACVRAGDTVARLGGDEFVVMLEDLSENIAEAAMQAEIVGEKILNVLNQIYKLNGHEYYSSCSIGVTLFGEQHENIDEPLKRADLAMHQAKAGGRNTVRFFDPHMQAEVIDRVALAAGLRGALAQNQFVLYYQAQVTEEGKITGAEALIRWQHPQRGLVSPAEFIPLAEETGIIFSLGQWVLETACVQLANWATRIEMKDLTIAVNVSARQFQHIYFVEQVLAVIAHTGANPQRLKLELTESLLVNNIDDVIEKMNRLKATGVSLSLDDFGTGYSSLSYLKRLPLDQLKIDKGFVKDILIDSNDAAIAKMVIVLADSMGLSVIAEGVETEKQRAFLVAQGCKFYQGYLFSRPLALEKFEEYYEFIQLQMSLKL